MKSESFKSFQSLILNWVQLSLQDKHLFVINHLFPKFVMKNSITYTEISESLNMFMTQDDIKSSVDELRKFLVLFREEQRIVQSTQYNSKYMKDIEIYSIDVDILNNLQNAISRL